MAVLRGTNGKDAGRGTTFLNTIFLYGGNDTVVALDGDDTVFGSAGDDLWRASLKRRKLDPRLHLQSGINEK